MGKFRDGAQALSEASGKFYEMELQIDRQLAAMTVDLGSPENSPDCPGITPWDCATKGKNLMSEARRNRAAVSSLAEYARGLHEIATFNDDENIEKASKELSGNLGDLAKTLDKSIKSEGILAEAISSLGQVYLDLKVQGIVYKKVKMAHPHVKTIAEMLRKDIKRQQQRFAINRLNTKATREIWFNGFRAGYQAPGTSHSDKAYLSLAAGKLVENELQDELAVQPSKLFFKKFEATVKSCVNAHKAIRKPDLSERSSTIVKFIGDARSLLSTLNQITN